MTGLILLIVIDQFSFILRYTNLAIGCVINHLVRTILHDQHSIQPISVRIEGLYGVDGVCLSVPCRVGREGVIGDPIHLNLDEAELAALRTSATVLKSHIDKMQISAAKM